LEHRYTRNEVERMTGVSRRDLEYWTRLRLLLPRARWGERFYNFSDLVALETIKRLAAQKVPASRIKRAITTLQTELGSTKTPLSMLRISSNGKQVVVHPPSEARPFEPLTGQFVMDFETAAIAKKIHSMASRSAEEWFEFGMLCDSDSGGSVPEAARAYQKAVEAAPEWVEARINLGTAMYQLGRMEEAYEHFLMAVGFEPENALAEFNLGCVLEQLAKTDEAITHLSRAVDLAPGLADGHLNLALAYERTGNVQGVLRHLSLYIRYEPNGPWAEFARSRIEKYRPPSPTTSAGKLTPFRKLN
jgi:tetratricopeptide (TPR) repeat protein